MLELVSITERSLIFFYFIDMMMDFWKLLVSMVLSTVPRSR